MTSIEANYPTVEVAGENSLIIYFGNDTRAEISAQVQATAQALQLSLGEKIIDLVPSYASLLVIFDVFSCDHLQLRHAIKQALAQQNTGAQETSRLVVLPAYYSQESGPDLENLANNAGLSIEQVIEIHQAQEYRAYAIGFAPGFAYLGQVDPRIAAPRLATPRAKVPKGAIAIADRQTAVYPAQSPGGWNLIGLCPKKMFDPKTEPNMPVAVGDRIRFKAIGREEFLDLGGELINFGNHNTEAK